jgi:uncharacterized protein (DUF433 family)
MTLPDFLTEWQFGEIVLTGHRIGLAHVIQRYRDDGFTPTMIAEYYPTLPLDLVRQVIDFYEANRAEVDTYVDRHVEECERLERETPRGPTLEELRARLKEMKGQERT